MNWEELDLALANRFGRDQYSTLIRQFFHIFQSGDVWDYIERFDALVHQLLAYDDTMSAEFLTARFIDGLKEDIRVVVVIQRPKDLDTACSLTILQEEVLAHAPRRDGRRNEGNSYVQPFVRASPMPLPPPPPRVSLTSATEDRKPVVSPSAPNSRGRSQDDDRMAVLMAYRKAKGLCYKCGERWNPSHKCATAVPLHSVEETWALVNEGEVLDEQSVSSDAGEHLMAISKNA